MATDSDRDSVQAMFLACASLARTDLSNDTRAKIEDLGNDIAVLLGVVTRNLARRKSAAGWSAATDVPGYLVRSFGASTIRVPFHLFDDIPADDVLDELLRIATDIGAPGGIICLSGSSAVYGALQHVGDCDFCEYLDADAQPDVVAAACETLRTIDGPSLVALELTGRGDSVWAVSRPWAAPVIPKEQSTSARSLMAHYFAETSFEGALEVTKLMIPLSSSDPAAKKRSFPAQEMPVADAGSWVPRVLNEPQEISDYVAFLRDDVKKHRSAHPSKAVKRAFSLARILFLDEPANEILKFLHGSDVLLEAALRSRAEYAEKVEKYDDGQFVPPLTQRVVNTVLAMVKRASRRELVQLGDLASDQILAAIRALPENDDGTVDTLLEQFLQIVDISIPAAVH